MARGERPLLARVESNTSSLRAAQEEDALLTGRPTGKTVHRRKWAETGLLIWALLATIVVVILSVVVEKERTEIQQHKTGRWGPNGKPTGKRNLIFMVSDGMGPASLEMTRSFRQYTQGLPLDDVLILDQHLVGQSRTRSSNSLVTDSAAGATAFSCGFKSYNGAISVLPDHSPCGTVLEAAKKAGYMTGLVVTTRITDATPACFASHANLRSYEDLIAEQLVGHSPLGRSVDLIIGGGRCHFLPNTTANSCRDDDTDVVRMARKNGFGYIDSRKQFDDLAADAKAGVELPLLALMVDTDIPYEINRRHVLDQYPSQLEMAEFALSVLEAATQDNEKGFFLLIEGSRVDHAGHSNDPAAQVHEVQMHDDTFAAVLKFLRDSETEGVVVSTSDHETGGLSAARQVHAAYPEYKWYPEVLARAKYGAGEVARQWRNYTSRPMNDQRSPSRQQQEIYLRRILEEGLGITDLTPKEAENIIDKVGNPLYPATWLFADLISKRAQIGWSTHGHSGVDVNIYASSPDHARPLVGNHENVEIGRFLAEYLDVDVDAVTKELKKKGVRTRTAGEDTWMGPVPPADQLSQNLIQSDSRHRVWIHEGEREGER